jgi:hypothetical protein
MASAGPTIESEPVENLLPPTEEAIPGIGGKWLEILIGATGANYANQ